MDKSYFGARVHKSGDCSFRIFAPHIQHAEISIINPQQKHTLEPVEYGFHEIKLKNIPRDAAYSYTLDGHSGIPDPASLWQPQGLMDASIIVDHHFFDWNQDSFSGLPMSEMIIYELHVGTFSTAQSFSGVISRLDHLKELGINTLQLMPINQFAGSKGWGYETIFPYAVHSPYGSPHNFKELVKQSHKRGLAVILDVTFSNLTPVNELEPVYTPFFSEKYNAPTGRILNFDEMYSYGVREFYIQCALSWFRDYHVDGLRINDAHTIFDQSPVHFLEELSLRVKDFAQKHDRHCILITGDKRNSLRPVLPFDKGGYDMDAMYNDDFHNALQYRIAGDSDGHLSDYSNPERIVSAMQYGFAYRGELSAHYMRQQGRRKSELQGCKFVVYSQNHDPQSGYHDKCRTIEKAGFEAAKLCAGATLLSPYIPMIFMGEEYGAPSPFHYFSDSHTGELATTAEDELAPEAESTFSQCLLNWKNMETDQGQYMLALYKNLLEVRKEHPTIHAPCRSRCQVQEIYPGLVLIFRNATSGHRKYAAVALNFSESETSCTLSKHLPEGIWITHIYSASEKYGGKAAPLPVILPREVPIVMAPQSFALFFYTEFKL